MNPITADLAALAAAITTAGVPATADPGMLLQLTAANPAAVLVGPPESLSFRLKGTALVAYAAPVTVVTALPNDLDATDRLTTAVLITAAVAPPLDPLDPATHTVGETDLPCYRWNTVRRADN